MLVPLLGAIPTIDLFPSTSGGGGYGYSAPESSYGAPEPSYGAPSDGYGAPGHSRNSWSQGEYRSVSFNPIVSTLQKKLDILTLTYSTWCTVTDCLCSRPGYCSDSHGFNWIRVNI